MKIQSLLLISSCFFLASFIGEKGKNDREKANLKGVVKSVTWYTYKGVVKMGLPEKDSLESKTIYKYDTNGHKTEEAIYRPDGSLTWKYSHIFDDDGRETSSSIQKTMKTTSSTYSFKADYKGSGHEATSTTENQPGITTTSYKYTLDDGGKITEMDLYKSDGSLISKNMRKYDANGNLIESDSYDNGGNNAGKSTFVYDDKGNLTVSSNYNSSGVLVVRTIFTQYDNTGEYNEETFTSPIFKYHHLYKHDDKGNMTEMKVLNKDGSTLDFTYQYEYDKMGNWIRKTVFKDDKLQSILEQEIQYY